MKTALAIAFAVLVSLTSITIAGAVGPGATDLAWTDNATNELGVKIERKDVACGTTGTWGEIGATGVDSKAYRDPLTVAGKDYCYRVRAWNNSKVDGTGVVQYSAYSNEAGVSYPLVTPAAQSGLTAQ